MAAKKTTAKKPAGKKAISNKKKTTAKQADLQKERQGAMPRAAWGAIWAVLGLFCLLSLLPIDGFLLKILYNGIAAMIGNGVYLFPFALFGLSALLFIREKGPVRLRGACVVLLSVFFGSIMHAFTSANEAFSLSVNGLKSLVEGGVAGECGGLISGGLYMVLEWGLSSGGALILLVLLFIAAFLCVVRVTPRALFEMFRAPDYEYENEEERQYYEKPVKLPNVHEVRAERAEKREAKRAANIDIPLDDEPIQKPEKTKPIIAPDEYLRSLKDEGPGEQTSILDLVENREEEEEALEPIEAKKPQKISQQEQSEINEEIDENQKAPVQTYIYPTVDLLTPGKKTSVSGAEQELQENSECLIDTLHSFGIDAKIIGIVRGPSVTRFELTIPRGIKISRISSLADDIALSLGAVSVRIAPIPDKVAVGIEVPNKAVNTVFIRECISSSMFTEAQSKVSFSVGKDITGKPVIGDIAKMPHMLIAGTTGSGKSVCINSMLISLLYKSTPEEVRLIMIDPKMVELGNYNGIPHLLIPVVTDPRKAAGALNWAVGEMERRYKMFADNQVRNLSGYNDLMRERKKEEEEKEDGVPDNYQVLPQIVIVVDELADLMMVAAKEVETSICRIAQKARAAGMHLVVATQRPSADVITGIMKANIPSRIAFAVASQIESRIILDTTGAEKLIGKGDMLYAPLGEGKPTRIQGCFISSDEIESVIAQIKETSTAEYNEEILEHIERQAEQAASGGSNGSAGAGDDEDEMLEEAIDVIMDTKQASTSMLQRRLKLGYARAARIMDQIEERGIIGASEGSKPRQILISREDWQQIKMRKHDIP